MEGAGGPPGPVVEISSGQIALVENNWNFPTEVGVSHWSFFVGPRPFSSGN